MTIAFQPPTVSSALARSRRARSGIGAVAALLRDGRHAGAIRAGRLGGAARNTLRDRPSAAIVTRSRRELLEEVANDQAFSCP